MARGDEDDRGAGGGGGQTDPPSGGYVYVGVDPQGQNVYRGSDGQMYTDDPNGMNGFGPYTGPGVVASTPPQTPQTPAPGGGGQSPLAPMPGAYVPGAIPDTPEFNAPVYHPPPAFSFEDFPAPEAFQGPTAADVLKDPSYEFRRDQGALALENSAAARGVGNGGGFLKDLLSYNQNLASTEYGNVWNRDLAAYGVNSKNAFDAYHTRYDAAAGTYATNLESQYRQPYEYSYRAAQDAFAPRMEAYRTQAQANQRNAEFGWDTQYRKWVEDFNRRFQTANA